VSSFHCPECGTAILDTPQGYITGCEHYPPEPFVLKPEKETMAEFLGQNSAKLFSQNPTQRD
jgi:hypothetical protein